MLIIMMIMITGSDNNKDDNYDEDKNDKEDYSD